jgi:D-arabinose 1-dehydrogenase-like Zn-dependent alcohol dehydrogenase
MSEPATLPKAARIIVAKRGGLSTTAIRTLKQHGVSVVFASDPASLTEFGATTFKQASDAAKVKAFDRMLTSGVWTSSSMAELYISYLKQAGNFGSGLI